MTKQQLGTTNPEDFYWSISSLISTHYSERSDLTTSNGDEDLYSPYHMRVYMHPDDYKALLHASDPCMFWTGKERKNKRINRAKIKSDNRKPEMKVERGQVDIWPE